MDLRDLNNKRVLLLADGARLPAELLQQLATSADLVVGIDGGTRQAIAAGVRVDILLGDLDSLDTQTSTQLLAQGVPVLRYPVEKDATDTELALELAVEARVREVVVISGVGDRLDHSFANLLLLGRYAAKVRLTWVSAFGWVHYLSEVSPSFSAEYPAGRVFSIISLSNCLEGLSILGAKYQLNGFSLNYGSTVGVSNQTTGGLLQVKTGRGLGAIVFPGVELL